MIITGIDEHCKHGNIIIHHSATIGNNSASVSRTNSRHLPPKLPSMFALIPFPHPNSPPQFAYIHRLAELLTNVAQLLTSSLQNPAKNGQHTFICITQEAEKEMSCYHTSTHKLSRKSLSRCAHYQLAAS